MTPHYSDDSVTVYAGDCLDVLRELPDASVDAVVTDPPAGIGFMNREWDHHKGGREQWVAWMTAVMAECHRVIKPGGHALVWAMPRTSHWTATALEDAGWDIRDCVVHLFGSGFPKSLDVSKAIDKAAGAERTEYPDPKWLDRYPNGNGGNHNRGEGGIYGTAESVLGRPLTTSDPATPDAERWQGWGTALKPASEHWWLARRPLDGTVAANVLTHGVGALNVDACRVEANGRPLRENAGRSDDGTLYGAGLDGSRAVGTTDTGRWPTNVVLDGSQAAELDRQSGASTSRIGKPRGAANGEGWGMSATGAEYDDAGGASRFFPVFKYEPKAPTHERPRADEVAHPTVKPLDLMRWLVKLVTPPGGTVLDPFAGSGTTAEACVIEHFRCITIEREPDYLPLIVARLTKPIQVGLDFKGLGA